MTMKSLWILLIFFSRLHAQAHIRSQGRKKKILKIRLYNFYSTLLVSKLNICVKHIKGMNSIGLERAWSPRKTLPLSFYFSQRCIKPVWVIVSGELEAGTLNPRKRSPVP